MQMYIFLGILSQSFWFFFFSRSTNAWGSNQKELVTSQAWKNQKKICAEEGLIAIAYDEKFGEYDRVYQVAKLLSYTPGQHSRLKCEKCAI